MLTVALTLLVCVSVLWVVSVIKKDASIIDIFWGSGFIVTACAYAWHYEISFTKRQFYALFFVFVWGLRLSSHILMRNWGKAEDYRYQEFRKSNPETFWWRSYFTIYLLQGVLIFFISLPFMAIFSDSTSAFGLLDYCATIVWGVGFYFEVVGDRELKQFKANPANKGKLLRTGLWSLTRHPNYFGDACLWWGFYLLSCSTQYGMYTILSPVVMTLFLVKVSGVGLIEKKLAVTKPGYKEYMEQVPAFIPKLTGYVKNQ